MKYIAQDGHEMESGKTPVTHKGKLVRGTPFIVGTFHSTETGNKSDGALQQLTIVRKYEEDGNFEVTITESTKEQIQEYLNVITIKDELSAETEIKE